MIEPYTVEYYQAINEDEKEQAFSLTKAIAELYHPKSVVDLGCGTGLYLFPFGSSDVELLGVDISEAAFDNRTRCMDRKYLKTMDIAEPSFSLPHKFDVALCLEVLEHIGNEKTKVLMENITKASDILIVSAAQPGQAGLNHVTLEPPEYWNKLFMEKGFKRDYHDEYQLILPVSQVHHTIWIIRNLMVFKRT